MIESWEELRETEWGVADGRKIPIKDLAIDHLVNILNWVKDRPTQYPASLLPLLEQEANFRKMAQFASGKPMPVQDLTGTWFLQDSKTGNVVVPKKKSRYQKVDKSKQ